MPYMVYQLSVQGDYKYALKSHKWKIILESLEISVLKPV